MLDFFRDLLVGEAQAAPHYWGAVLLAHAFIGTVLFIFITAAARTRSREVWFAAAAYGALFYAGWETVQIILGADPMDSLLDLSAVALGAISAAALWDRRIRTAAAAVVSLLAIGFVGVVRRVRRGR